MKALTVLACTLSAVVGSLSTANAEEVIYRCVYETEEGDKSKKRHEPVSVAIDIETKHAKIDWGKGWEDVGPLEINGNEVEDADPPNGGMLGAFYFDLSTKSGGIGGGMNDDQFFSDCTQ